MTPQPTRPNEAKHSATLKKEYDPKINKEVEEVSDESFAREKNTSPAA